MANSERRHLLPGFDAALEELRTNILLMGMLARRNLSNAKVGFLTRNDDYCAAVIADDEEVDILEKQVDREGTAILLKFQPMTFDLCRVLATIKLGTHLERLSDQAVVIARRVRKLNEDPVVDEMKQLQPLFDALERALFHTKRKNPSGVAPDGLFWKRTQLSNPCRPCHPFHQDHRQAPVFPFRVVRSQGLRS
jgi:phosphate uptake regulator